MVPSSSTDIQYLRTVSGYFFRGSVDILWLQAKDWMINWINGKEMFRQRNAKQTNVQTQARQQPEERVEEQSDAYCPSSKKTVTNTKTTSIKEPLGPRPNVSGYFWIRNFFYPGSKIYSSTRCVFKSNSPVHTYPMVSGFTLAPKAPLH